MRYVWSAAILAAALAFGGAARATEYGNCHWDGSAPFCNGSCESGFVVRKTQACVTGHKVLCCEPMGSVTYIDKVALPRWTAVASDGKGFWAWAAAKRSALEARMAVLQSCSRAGCRVLKLAEAKCFSIAEKSPAGAQWAITYGDARGEVEDKAQGACTGEGHGDCVVVKTACSR